jgi:hypothetical protein
LLVVQEVEAETDFSVQVAEVLEAYLLELFRMHQVITQSQSEAVEVVLEERLEAVTEVTHLFQV